MLVILRHKIFELSYILFCVDFYLYIIDYLIHALVLIMFDLWRIIQPYTREDLRIIIYLDSKH